MHMLKKFKKKVVDLPRNLTLPFDLSGKPKYSKMEQAMIIDIDKDRVHVIDEMLTNLYTVYVLLIDRSFQEAFVKIFINICMA